MGLVVDAELARPAFTKKRAELIRRLTEALGHHFERRSMWCAIDRVSFLAPVFLWRPQGGS